MQAELLVSVVSRISSSHKDLQEIIGI